MSDGWKMKDGKKPYLQRLKRIVRMAGSYGAQTQTAGTGDRSEGDNIIIIRKNAKQGRNIEGVTSAERKKGQDIWSRATAEYAKHGRAIVLERAADKIGQLLVGAYRNHILRGAGADGKFRDVKESTKRIKKQQTGRGGLPPMYRTGALMRSFIYKVIKR